MATSAVQQAKHLRRNEHDIPVSAVGRYQNHVVKLMPGPCTAACSSFVLHHPDHRTSRLKLFSCDRRLFKNGLLQYAIEKLLCSSGLPDFANDPTVLSS